MLYYPSCLFATLVIMISKAADLNGHVKTIVQCHQTVGLMAKMEGLDEVTRRETVAALLKLQVRCYPLI